MSFSVLHRRLWIACGALLLAGGTLTAGPNEELPANPLVQPALSGIEIQRASIQRQMSGAIARAREVAASLNERQRSSADRQRAAVERQLRSVQLEESARNVFWQEPVQVASANNFIAARPQPNFTSTGEDPDCDRITPSELNDHIEEAAERESLTPELLNVVIARESAFQPCAVSSKGAMGLMQLMPGTAMDLGVENPFDPKANIDGGARYLGLMMQRFGGDLKLALAAYNAGPRRVDTYQGIPPIPETVDYVSSILKQLHTTPVQTIK